MGRMYTPGKGISRSAIPYSRVVPDGVCQDSEEIHQLIYRYAHQGLSPSQIGDALRDRNGIPRSRLITGVKILRILKKAGLAPNIPEDLYCLIKKALAIRSHLDVNRKDRDAKYRLILCESRIHRLARYYKTTKVLPPMWKYTAPTAAVLIA